MGIVSRVVKRDHLLDVAVSLAQRIASHSAPVVTKAKECIAASFEMPLEEGLKFEKREFWCAPPADWSISIICFLCLCLVSCVLPLKTLHRLAANFEIPLEEDIEVEQREFWCVPPANLSNKIGPFS